MRLITFSTLKSRITEGLFDGLEPIPRDEAFQRLHKTTSWVQIGVMIVSLSVLSYFAYRFDAKYRRGAREPIPNCIFLFIATCGVTAFEAIGRDRGKRAYGARFSKSQARNV